MERRTLAILKPYETTWDAFLADHELSMDGCTTDTFNAHLDELIEDHIEEVRRVASALNIDIEVEEYELLPVEKGIVAHSGGIVSKQRDKAINQADIIGTIDPPGPVLAYIMHCVNRHPLTRSIVGFKTYGEWETALALTQRLQTPLFAQEQFHALPKLYPVPLNVTSPTFDTTISNALLYPHTRAQKSDHMRKSLFLPYETEIEFIDESRS